MTGPWEQAAQVKSSTSTHTHTVPVAERPADAFEAVGSREDDRRMGIPDRYSEDIFVSVQVEVLWVSVSVRLWDFRTTGHAEDREFFPR